MLYLIFRIINRLKNQDYLLKMQLGVSVKSKTFYPFSFTKACNLEKKY